MAVRKKQHRKQRSNRVPYDRHTSYKRPVHIGFVEATWAASAILVILGTILAMSSSHIIKIIAVWVFVVAVVIGSIAAGFRLTHELLESHNPAPSEPKTQPQVFHLPEIDRPWLAVTEVRAKGPLRFIDEAVNHIASLPVEWVVKNTGRGAANDVIVKADIFYPSRADPFAGEEVIQRQKAVCAETWKGPGVTIFPDATHTFSMEFVLGIKEMEAAGLAFKEANNWGNFDGKDVRPCLVGCVSYTFGDSFRSETGFAYDIAGNEHKVSGTPTTMTLRIGRNLPADKIEFQKFPNGGDYVKTDRSEKLANPTPAKERPYVFLEARLLPFAAGDKLVLHYIIESSGPVEAAVINKGWTYYFIADPTVTILKHRPDTISQSFQLVPGEHFDGYFRSHLVLSEERIALLNDGKARLFFYARAEYSDKQGHGTYPLPLCFMYDRDMPNKLVKCPSGITME